MAGLLKRLFWFAVEQDQAIAALGGAGQDETLSGVIGRACNVSAYGRRRWWGPLAARLVDGIFGAGHCADQAMKEARRRAAREAGIIP